MRKQLPFLILVLGAVIGAFALRDYISFDVLRENRQTLLQFQSENAVLMALVFVSIYFLIVAFSLPGAAVASVTGGFLFGLWLGTFLNVLAASLGAMVIFAAARHGFADRLTARAGGMGPKANDLLEKIRNNEISVMLMLRLIPVVPFFLANLLPALVGVKFRNFAWTTVVGILPGGLVFTWIGVGLGDVFDRGQDPDLSLIWSPHILGPLLGLAALSALPMFINKKDHTL